MGLSERKMGVGGKKGKSCLGEYGAEATERGSRAEGDSVCSVVCEARAHLTVVTLHVVVSVHGYHTNGRLTALEKEVESHVCSLT